MFSCEMSTAFSFFKGEIVSKRNYIDAVKLGISLAKTERNRDFSQSALSYDI